MSTAQFETGAIALLGGLLADPAGLRKRLAEYTAARSAALAAEEGRDAAQSDFADHEEAVASELARLEKHVAERRGRVEAQEGLNESNHSTLAGSEWAGLKMPHEVSHG